MNDQARPGLGTRHHFGPDGETSALRWLPPLALALAFAFSLGITCLSLGIFAKQPAGVDFLPVWTAARLAPDKVGDVYDFALLTELQRWLIGDRWEYRPFIYPPSSLLLVAPFGALDFWVSYMAWLACISGLYLWSVSRNLPSLHIFLLVLVVTSRPFVLAAFAGQASLLVAALLVLAVSMLDSRYWLAGVLIGVAGSIKPTLLALAPMCLIAGGHYRALAGAAITGLAIALASLLAFGIDPWFHWLSALSRFEVLIASDRNYLPSTITPTAAALLLGLDGWALHAMRLGFAVAGAAIAWIVFRNRNRFEQRLTALVGSGLLLSPYALQYEVTMLFPAAMIVLARAAACTRWVVACAVLVLLTCAALPFIGAYATLGLIALVLFYNRSTQTLEASRQRANLQSAVVR
jgi:hypothetical protein